MVKIEHRRRTTFLRGNKVTLGEIPSCRIPALERANVSSRVNASDAPEPPRYQVHERAVWRPSPGTIRHILVYIPEGPILRFLSVLRPETLKAYIWRAQEAHLYGYEFAPNARSYCR
jgi:hypothetical protein